MVENVNQYKGANGMRNYFIAVGMLCSMVLLTFSPWEAKALTISLFDANTQQNEIGSWVNNLGGHTTVAEDFEGLTPGWSNNLSTGVGTFATTDNTLAGTGSTSYESKTGNDGIFFELRDYDANGRANTTEGTSGSNYLDSADITELLLSVTQNTFNNLFFFVTDASDIRANTTITASGQGSAIGYRQNNGSNWFVGIDAGPEYISEIAWTTTHKKFGTAYTNDGFGVDDFTTVSSSPIPEPATMLLFGTGLIGLGSRLRKKKK